MCSSSSDAPKRRSSCGRNTSAGLFFLGVGLVGLWGGRDLTIGTAEAMAEGYFPRVMCVLLLMIGGVITVTGLRRPDHSIGSVTLRPLAAVTASILVFAIGLERLGLLLTVAASVIFANLAGRPLRILSLLGLCAVLAVSIALIFVWGLGLPVRLIPPWPE